MGSEASGPAIQLAMGLQTTASGATSTAMGMEHKQMGVIQLLWGMNQ